MFVLSLSSSPGDRIEVVPKVVSSECVQVCLSVSLTGDDVVTVNTPAFAESVTEGDVRWEKGKWLPLPCNSQDHSFCTGQLGDGL